MTLLPGDPCPRCRAELHPRRASSHGISDDHILPRAWGGSFVIHGDTNNRRVMCRQCNILLGTVGHCVAALACVEAVAQSRKTGRRDIIREWRLGLIATQMPQPRNRVLAERRADRSPWEWEDVDDRRREAIEAAMERIGLDQFVWPAVTAAERVWNMATLGKRYGGAAPAP